MSYWVYGSRQVNDPLGLQPQQLQPADPLFIEADSEQEAIAKATEAGIVVSEVEYIVTQPEQGSPPESRPNRASSPERRKNAQYEFTERQRSQIASLAAWMRWASLILLLGAVLSGFVAADWTGLISCVLGLLIALFTWGSAISFQRFVDTRGQDIDYIMIALNELRKLFMFQVLLVLVGLVVLGLLLGVLQVRR